MSGEGSSTRPKRSRRPVVRRTIKYNNPYEPLLYKPDNPIEHPLLDFQLMTEERERLDRFSTTIMLEHRIIDWDWLRGMGSAGRVADILGPRMVEALDCRWEQYHELTLEFHCTFKHKEGTFAEDDAISFSLGRNVYEMNMARFGVVMGFYSADEVRSDDFRNSLRGVSTYRRTNFLKPADLKEFWESISTAQFAKTNLISTIRDPIYRYIMKILGSTIMGRRSGKNKANSLEIYALMCMVQNRNWNLANFFALSCNRGRRGGGDAAMDLGPYIYFLAGRLGALDKYQVEHMKQGPVTRVWSIPELQLAGILTWDDPPQWEQRLNVQPLDEEAAEGAAPAARYRPPLRPDIPAHAMPFYPPREPRPSPPRPMTHETVYDMTQQRFDQLEDRMNVNQQWTMQSHHRQDDMLRYMMRGMSLDIPQPFTGLLPPPDYSDQRTPYIYGQYPGYNQWGQPDQPAQQDQPGGSGTQHMEQGDDDDE